MTIQQLIANNQTLDALTLLLQTNSDAQLLMARYNGGKKNFALGTIDFGEWQRIQAQVNYAVLELAPKTHVTINAPFVQNNTYITFLTNDDRPGNELALFNKIYRALEKMVEDQDYPLEEIETAVRTMHKYLPMDDYIDVLGDFKKDRYLQGTPPMKTKARREFAEMLLDTKRANLDVIRQAVTEVQTETTWQQAWAGLLENPTKNHWDQTRRLIDKRLTAGIFTDAQRSQWEDVAGDVDDIEDGMFWKIKFNRHLADLKHWVTSNLR